MMIEIVDSKANSQYLAEVTGLFQSEWSDFEPYVPIVNGYEVPLPVLAFCEAQLIGGLAFTRFPAPNTDAQALWINAVVVNGPNRNQGISSRLIQYAEQIAKSSDELALYVYTHIPKLYQKLGWEIADTHDEHTVLSKRFS